MRRTVLIIASVVGALVIGYAVYLSQVVTTAPAGDDGVTACTTNAPKTDASRCDNNGQTGKPGEVKN
jgi:hypothetical protein